MGFPDPLFLASLTCKLFSQGFPFCEYGSTFPSSVTNQGMSGDL